MTEAGRRRSRATGTLFACTSIAGKANIVNWHSGNR